MSFLVIQSVPLGRDTRRALSRVGGETLAHNADDLDQQIQNMQRIPWEFILNMGNTQVTLTEAAAPIVNLAIDINKTRTPGALRKNFDEFLPPYPKDQAEYPLDCWIKAPGRGGRGKYHKAVDYPLVLPDEWDCQQHVEGTEYRVITVGRRAVQGFIREGTNNNRTYSWTGLANTPDEVLTLARQAAKELPHNSLRAWDLIQAPDRTYILESNSSPGMNDATAERVRDEISRQIREERIN